MHIDVDKIALMAMNKTHVYIKPHTYLQDQIAHYTYLKEEEYLCDQPLTLIPDVSGCIVLSYDGDVFECSFWGPTTHCVEVIAKPQKIKFHFFIEFLPCGSYAIFHRSMDQFQNIRMDLNLFHRDLYQRFSQAFEESKALSEFIKRIDAILLEFTQRDVYCIKTAQKMIEHGFSIPRIVEHMGYSTRHLQRMFASQSGTGMKEYQRIIRINQAIDYLESNMQIVQIAALLGYYDEAHFIHDFKNITKMTPVAYRTKMSDFYKESLKI